MQTIKVQISKTGEVEYEVAGIKGAKCKDITKQIDDLCGKVLESKVTGEYCQTEPDQRVKIKDE